MTAHDLEKVICRWGLEIKKEHKFAFRIWLGSMLQRNRVMLIWNQDEVEAVLFYYLTNDYRILYKKPTWSIPKEDADGKQIYIDKLIARTWTKPMRELVYKMFLERFPKTTDFYYHRSPKDRLIHIKAKGVLV
jgi:hypothetical protein